MADVTLIINSLTTVATAPYVSVKGGPPPSRKTGHQIAFEALQGSAGQVAGILTQNPRPNRDSQENISAQFGSMKKNLEAYCTKTAGTDSVLRAFNKASAEWSLLVAGK